MSIIAPISRIMPATNTATDGTDSTSTGATSSGSGSTTTAGSTELGREAFLQLLVAQLKYQDPSKPMDASEMIAQSAQLTMVDKLSDISKALASQAVTQQLTLAGSVVGKQITFTSPEGAKVSAIVNSVKFANGGLVLSTPDWDVPMSSVESIGTSTTTPASAAPATSTPPTNTSTTGTSTTGTSTTGTSTTGTSTTGTSPTGTATTDTATTDTTDTTATTDPTDTSVPTDTTAETPPGP